MKVGDYVRIINTLEEYVEITKIKKIFEIPFSHEEHILDYRGYEYNCDEIVKSSPNIIDLIEVGDYVNGHRVLDIAEAPKRVLYLNDISQKGALLPRENIKSVLTKEQFESMEYEVK